MITLDTGTGIILTIKIHELFHVTIGNTDSRRISAFKSSLI